MARLPDPELILYDGSCGLCTWSVQAALSRWSYPVAAIPYQWLSDRELSYFGTTAAECARAVHFIDANNSIHRGAEAINAYVSRFPIGMVAVRVLRLVYPLLLVERLMYRAIAANRSLLSRILGTTRYATIEAEEGQAREQLDTLTIVPITVAEAPPVRWTP